MLKLFKIIGRIIKQKPKAAKVYFADTEHRVIPAFECGGVTYYRFEDLNKAPSLRAVMAMQYYREMQQCVDQQYLEDYIIDCEKIFNSSRVDIYKLKQFLDFLKMRTKIFDLELVYRLASVIFFDERENMYNYDYTYNTAKIAKWKKDSTIESFFLSEPIRNLAPFLNGTDVNLAEYYRQVESIKEAEKVEREKILGTIPPR